MKWFGDTKQTTKAVALFTFEAASETELSFKEGETINVLNIFFKHFVFCNRL